MRPRKGSGGIGWLDPDFHRDGVSGQLRMILRQPGKGWKTMLEEMLGGIK